MKNTCLFYIIFQVLKVLLTKICKIEPPDLLFFLSFTSAVSFFTNFQNFIEHYLKKIFCHKFSFFNGFTKPPTPFNAQNPLRERTLSMQEGGGGGRGFYKFFKNLFVAQETIQLSISWPSNFFRKYFMVSPINLSFLFKAYLQQYFRVVLSNIHNNIQKIIS